MRPMFRIAYPSALLLLAGLISAAVALLRKSGVYKVAGRLAGGPRTMASGRGTTRSGGFQRRVLPGEIADRHQYDNTRPEVPTLARSLDGGRPGMSKSRRAPSSVAGRYRSRLTEPMDFTEPDFAMKLWFDDASKGPSWFWYSKDRGHNWRGPFRIHHSDSRRLQLERTTLLTATAMRFCFSPLRRGTAKRDASFVREPRTAGCAGISFHASVTSPRASLSCRGRFACHETEILTATRVKEDQETSRIDMYASTDNAATWSCVRGDRGNRRIQRESAESCPASRRTTRRYVRRPTAPSASARV